MSEAPLPTSRLAALARLIEEFQGGIWRYLRVLGCEASLADDLTQETFLAAMQRPFEEINSAATAAYLRTIAKNLLISHHRRRGKVVAVEDVEKLDQSWSNWAGNDGGDRALDALRDCLHGLGARARKALEMRFRKDCTREEIAQSLELSEDGAKNLMQRAKQKLRACVEEKLRRDDEDGR